MPGDLSYLYPMYPILGAIACILCFIPIPWHWKAGNIAVTALGLWVLGLNIIFWIGTIVWHNNIRNPYPIWGDIVNVYMAIWPTAISSASLYIQYRLWKITRARSVFISKKEKRRHKFYAVMACLGLPMLVGPIHYVVQGHRYNVYEDLGPIIATYDVVPAFPLFFIMDPIICIIEAVFCILTLRTLITRRKEMDEALAIGSSNVNKNHFVRLLCLSGSAVAFHLPLGLWVVLGNAITFQVAPWISWEDTHSNYGRIAYYDRTTFQEYPQFISSTSVMLFGTTLAALLYFFLFGVGEPAMNRYLSFIGAILRPFGIKYPLEKKRDMIKRTWYEVLLGRFAKSPNTSSPTPSMQQLNSSPSKSRISGIAQLTTVPALLNDNTGLPESLGSSLNGDKGKQDRRNELILEQEIRDINDERVEWREPGATSGPSTTSRLDDSDLEAREPSLFEVQSARRIAILEKNPELTEEVTF